VEPGERIAKNAQRDRLGHARAESGGGPWAFTMYLDAARMRWYRYIVNWSLQDQRVMVSTMQRQAQDLRLQFTWPGDWRGVRWLAAAGAALAAVGLIWIARRVWRTSAVSPGPRIPRFYEHALGLLERRGLSPGPAETARQFCGRAAAAAPFCALPLARITEAYERARFGSAPLSEDELSDLEGCLAELADRRA